MRGQELSPKAAAVVRVAFRYLVAVIATAIAGGLRWKLDPLLGGTGSYVTFYFSVLIVAMVAGLGPGLVALALGAIVANPLYAQLGHPSRGVIDGAFRLVFFVLNGAAALVLADRYRRSEVRSDRLRDAGQFPEENVNPVFRLDAAGRFLYANEACCQLLATDCRPGVPAPKTAGDAARLALQSDQPSQLEIELAGTGDRLFSFTCVGVPHRRHVNFYGRDVTDTRRAQQEVERERARRTEAQDRLLDSEQRSRLLIEGVKDYAIVMLSPDGTVASWNTGAERLKGYRAGEIVGQHYSRFFTEEDQRAGRPQRELELARRTGRFEDEGWRVRKDGSRFWANVVVTVVRDETGAERGFAKVVRDTTERKAAESVTSRLAAIIEDSEDAILSKGLEGTILSWNKAAERMLGYSAEEAVGQPVTMLIPEDRLAEEDQILARIARDEHVEHYETVRVTKAGDQRAVSVAVSPLRSPDGTVIGASKIMRDITERKRAEEALRESEDRFLTMANTIPQLDWMARADGYIYWYNDRWYQYTGTTPEQMAGWGWQSVHDPNVLPRVLEQWKGSIASGKPFDMVFPLRGADGRFRPFLTRVQPVKDSEGKVSLWFGTNTDVSEIEDARKALQKSEQSLHQAMARLAEADRRKDEFIAVLSHELRNPLAPIRYALPILKRESLSAAGGRAADVIDRQTGHLTRLVDDLLDVSRITRGKIELRRETVALDAIITAAVEAASPAIAAARHNLDLQVARDTIWLNADAARIAQVVTNLLDNSAKYTPRGGRITLEATRDDGGAVIRVRDNGIGIPPEALSSVFDMFRQVRREGPSPGGLGIGLALVKSLVEMHGGRIEARSSGIGQGAEFVVRLPVAGAARVDQRVDVPEGSAAGKRRLKVLVVDDNADLVEMLTLLVEDAGHEVRKALDGRSAIAAALSYKPDVVLLDLGLPIVGGLDVARELRRHPEMANTRLVALTGWGQLEDRRQTKEAGFAAHLTKPAEPERLQRLLERVAVETG